MVGMKTDVDRDSRYDPAPSILVITDNGAGMDSVVSAIESLNARTLSIVSLTDAEKHLAQLICVSAIVVHVTRPENESLLGALLGTVENLADEGCCGAVVIVAGNMIDTAFSFMTHPGMQLLADPDEADILGSLALACAPRPLRLNDAARQGDSAHLVQLSEEVGRIARTLARLAENPPSNSGFKRTDFTSLTPMKPDAAAAARVRGLIRARRTRDQFFRTELFADPAWDMLLDLMAARLDDKQVSVSSLCIAASVPATTALRWIKSMTDEGLFVRRADDSDGRRIFIELSDQAAGAMNAYLDWLKVNSLMVV